MNSRLLLASLALSLLIPRGLAASTTDDQTPHSPFALGLHLGFNLGGALPPTVPKPVEKVMHFNLGAAPNVGIDLSLSPLAYQSLCPSYGDRVRGQGLLCHSTCQGYAYPLPEL